MRELKAYKATCPTTTKNTPNAMSPNGHLSSSVFKTSAICRMTYTARKTALKMYNTTKRAVVEVGDKLAHPWKVQIDTAPEIKKAPSEDRRSNYIRCDSKTKYP